MLSSELRSPTRITGSRVFAGARFPVNSSFACAARIAGSPKASRWVSMKRNLRLCRTLASTLSQPRSTGTLTPETVGS